MNRKLAVLAFCLILWLPLAAGADTLTDPMSDPFGYFNVYSLGAIGSSARSYGSDFQGTAGAAGDVYFNSFSLHGMDSATGVVLHTGGSATLGGSYLGRLEVGGNLTIGGLNIEGNVNVGGNVNQSGGGTVNGNVLAGGNVALGQEMTVNGTKTSGSAYNPMVDHLALSMFFTSTSEMIGAWNTTGTVVNMYGGLSFSGTHGVNVVTIGAEELRNAWGFTVNAPEDAVVYINVINEEGSPVTLDSTDWTYSGGIPAGNVLLNMPVAESLYLSGGNHVNILAPFAGTVFSSGVITGSLVAGGLEGSGQVNLGHFQKGGSAGGNPAAVPEPGTLGLMLAGLAAWLVRRKNAMAQRLAAGLKAVFFRIRRPGLAS